MPASLALVLVLASVLAPQGKSVREDDVLYLHSGKKATGQLVYEDEQVFVLKRGSREEAVPRAEVLEVDARTRTLAELLERLLALAPLDQAPPEALLELATFAANGRLEGEAQLLRLRALLTDPQHGGALAALGARERGKSHTLKLGNATHVVAELSTPPGRWRDRWTFTTLHYELQTNLPLDQAIAAAFDTERLFHTFYDQWGRVIELHEPSESMPVQIHADDVSYPEPSDKRRSGFDPSDRIVHVNAVQPDWRAPLVHELVRQLCHQTTARERSGKGHVPRWLAVGLGESLAAGASGSPGALQFDLAAPLRIHLQRHAEASKPYELSRVLAFGDEDFARGTDLDLRYAQSYTLVQFALYGEDGAHRPGFMAFLRHVWAGRSALSQFQTDLGIQRAGEFEQVWLAWVKQAATL